MKPSEKFEELWKARPWWPAETSAKKMAFYYFCEGDNWKHDDPTTSQPQDSADEDEDIYPNCMDKCGYPDCERCRYGHG